MSFIDRILGRNPLLRKQAQAHALGATAEELAADFLQRKGVSVVQRNYRVRGGEIDLICRDGEVLIFVEVRLRTNAEFGGAAASITSAKRLRLVLAAEHWLQKHGMQPACRFDCVLLERLDGKGIRWIKDAFANAV